MAELPQSFKLNTGAEIPALGLGTWQSKPGEVRAAVKHALQSGYRHIDAAYCYGNEEEVGIGLLDTFKSGAVKREDVFVTTKLWCTYHTRVEENFEKSLKALGLEYIDLYLMHWPVAMNPEGNHENFPTLGDGSRDLMPGRSHVETYKDMEKLLGNGKVKAIGVANYSLRYLKELLSQSSITPAVNQIENHVLLPQQEIVDFCREHSIHVTAYSPLGSNGSPLMQLPVIENLATYRNVSPAVILLSWHVSCGRSVLAKSITPSRIEQNKCLVNLGRKELEAINIFIQSLAKNQGFTRYVYPAFGVDFGFPDKQ
ncbi:NADP(+) coupled glycerol dehydrogenase [Penicillium canescens]|uniref:D-xylose reductase [NAD(P)H] n=1 Tax=Penicillium canescens TaxID=5083 RepID=A0AAD6IR76_PENCN|nr:NADP(+) coupled glycerol dehydrogenase [Penicillium canescens]KAJ5981786.1 NADP(+) coupled glycerol dehydrogenase [Penicillium canescens]KAJ6032890.1 NADP(+) coupled glycerol dehydrogenase [Penicillium canescens]KAJ6057918.1 NADP(+) coupled glycerol dehydrogenase [Penicillium canescens]KAJ6059233.1 NADP(+) coupled glycerol dehydrogenase [Penicillium canescens]KAJ6071144.1 NADP(+) coupled glycerol dehydrogenase [Penicillium canescens]